MAADCSSRCELALSKCADECRAQRSANQLVFSVFDVGVLDGQTSSLAVRLICCHATTASRARCSDAHQSMIKHEIKHTIKLKS